jgi:hypothetical protein
VARSTRSSVRLAARARRYARYAHLRMIRHQRRLALLQMRKQRQAHAQLASRARHHAQQVKLAARGFDAPGRGSPHFGDQRHPVPLPLPRLDMLCTDDRGFVTAGGASASACVSSQRRSFKPPFPAWFTMWTRLTAGFQRHLRQDRQAGSWRR